MPETYVAHNVYQDLASRLIHRLAFALFVLLAKAAMPIECRVLRAPEVQKAEPIRRPPTGRRAP